MLALAAYRLCFALKSLAPKFPIAPQVEEVKGKEEEIVSLERQAAQREQSIVDLERSVEELSGQVGEGGVLAWGWNYSAVMFVCRLYYLAVMFICFFVAWHRAAAGCRGVARAGGRRGLRCAAEACWRGVAMQPGM